MSDKLELPYSYIGDAKPDLRYFPKVGDKLKVTRIGAVGTISLQWARDNDELLVVAKVDSKNINAEFWNDAGFVCCDFISEKGRNRFPNFGETNGYYFSRFDLVEFAKTDEETLAELDNLIVVKQEDE